MVEPLNESKLIINDIMIATNTTVKSKLLKNNVTATHMTIKKKYKTMTMII